MKGEEGEEEGFNGVRAFTCSFYSFVVGSSELQIHAMVWASRRFSPNLGD